MNKGFALLPLLIAIAAITLISGGSALVYQAQQTEVTPTPEVVIRDVSVTDSEIVLLESPAPTTEERSEQVTADVDLDIRSSAPAKVAGTTAPAPAAVGHHPTDTPTQEQVSSNVDVRVESSAHTNNGPAQTTTPPVESITLNETPATEEEEQQEPSADVDVDNDDGQNDSQDNGSEEQTTADADLDISFDCEPGPNGC